MSAAYKVQRNFRSAKPVVAGIYFLFESHDLVYVGQSVDCYLRISKHRANARPFDFALVMPCPNGDLRWVEAALITALAPRQNTKGHYGPSPLGLSILEEIIKLTKEEALAPELPTVPVSRDPLEALSITAARQIATDRGISAEALNRAWREELPTFAKSERHRNTCTHRSVRAKDFDAWCFEYQDRCLAETFRAARASLA